MKEENLIFIVSQPRSGSTFLQNLLSNNSQVNTCSEPWILLNYVNQLNSSLVEGPFDNQKARKAFEIYLSNMHHSSAFFEKQKEFILDIYNPLLEGYGYDFVIDKTPRYWQIMEEIRKWFPNSKMIILKRNPVDVAKSIMKTWHIGSLTDLQRKFYDDLILGPEKIHSFSLKNKKNRNVYVTTYEELIGKTSMTVKDIYSWLEIAYSDEVLDVTGNSKYKGEFGDPFQNSDEGYLEIKTKVDGINLSSRQENFLQGYSYYLGRSFLEEYGNYELHHNSRKTSEFEFFFHKYQKQNLRTFLKEVKMMSKQFYYSFKGIK